MSTAIFSEVRRAFEARLGDRVRFDEPLAPYLAYRVGGPADILTFPADEADLVWIREAAMRFALPMTVVGTGTNLLVRDEGIRGITISLQGAFQEIEERGGDIVRVGGGVEKPRLLDWAIENRRDGLVFSAGVPGTIGGGIYMNAGTKYGCYADVLRRLRLFDFATGPRELSREEAHFGYREQTAVKNSLVLWAEFQLPPGDPVAMRAEVNRIIAERAEKQPLDFPSCGSTFKNPDGHSAGRLIEKAGLKGLRVGGAEISLKHANFILNKESARASDILQLIGIIQQTVYNQFEVQLECEVIVLGG